MISSTTITSAAGAEASWENAKDKLADLLADLKEPTDQPSSTLSP